MKFAVISDIHANAAALREVLKNIDKAGISDAFCLGDNIGYGPEPETVIQMLRDNNIPSIIGNHELAVNDAAFLDWFNPVARLSLEKTMEFISESTKDYIAGLPTFLVSRHCRFVHGFPPDSPTEYLFEVDEELLKQTFIEMREQVCFVGHTHELLLIEFVDGEISRRPLKRQTVSLNTDFKYIINVGSVGQPRDGNNYAKYVVFDDEVFEFEVKFVPYNITETVSKIYQAGLPEQHAWRLF